MISRQALYICDEINGNSMWRWLTQHEHVHNLWTFCKKYVMCLYSEIGKDAFNVALAESVPDNDFYTKPEHLVINHYSVNVV